jgi:TonB-linked SusC/RagA family outer membrane protein
MKILLPIKIRNHTAVVSKGRKVTHLFKCAFLVMLFAFAATAAFAQRQVSGKVTGAPDKVPLPGVTILVKGTTNGTITDGSGAYAIQVPAGQATLVFSFLGFLTQEVAVGNQTTVHVALKEDSKALDEVVVIGYGTQKRSDLTGAVSSVSEKDFADMPIQSVDQALAGRIPGLDVVSSGTQPGFNSQIRMRGNRSFTASNDPLIILNGVPFYGSINDINPYDIQAIDVLKDASSTAIYGSRGANGVIIITTKSGEEGPPQFMLESYAGPKMAYGRLPYMNGAQYAERGREALRQAGNYTDPNTNSALDQKFFDPTEFKNIQEGNSFDYPEALLQHGFQQKHQLTIRGGSNAISYNFSGNVFNEEGLFPGREFNRYSVSTKLNFTLSPKVTAGTSILLSHNVMEAKTDDGALNAAVQTSPLGSPYEADGTPRYLPTGDGFSPHPLADYEWDAFRWDNKRWAAYATTFVDVKIFPELNYRINLGTDLKLHNIKSSQGQYSYASRGGPPIAGVSTSVANQNLYESILTYNKTFNDKHQLTVTGIHGLQTSKEEMAGVNVSRLPFETSRYHNIGSAETINSVASNLSEWNLLSYAGRLFYGYNSKYLMTLSFRADGASQFSTDHKWGYFPSAALAWNISEESFLRGANWLSNLKLRVSYGVSGNQGIAPYQTQGSLSRSTYAWDETPAYGYRSSTLANPDLKWESTETYNLGLDFGFLKGRINGSLEVYNTNTFDLIMLRLLPINTGYNQVLENVGSTNNKGFELSLNTVNIDKNNFKWNSDLSFYLNREKIVELFNGQVDDIGNRWFIGNPIHVYYDFNKVGIWQLPEAAVAAEYKRKPGQIKVQDLDGNRAVNDADRMIVGSRQPKFVANLANRFTYKDWDLAFTTYARWGNTIYVGHLNPASGKRYNHLALDYWTPNNPTNAHPRPDDDVQGSLEGSSQAYRDGSFIRLRQLSLGYTLPDAVLGKTFLSKARVYVSGENLWYWTKSEMHKFNMEPEWSADVALMPAIRTFVAGLNVSF